VIVRTLFATFLLALPPAGAPQAASSPQEVFDTKVKPLLGKYCYKCHGPQLKPKADLNLTKYQSEASVRDNRKLFREVVSQIHAKVMPPKEAEVQPTPEERAAITSWFEAAMTRVDKNAPKGAGRVVWRRLNRTEYRNTVRDLLGVDFDPRDFPSDDVGYGFDNIGDVLSLPPLLVEKYVAASKRIADKAVLPKPDPAKPAREAARPLLERLLLRAFRRPPSVEETERFLKLFDAGEKLDPAFPEAFKLPLRTILISPHFLFRVELDGMGETYALNEFELASRLSYFLWASMPDDELLEKAGKGALRKELDAQVARMLKDPKSVSLAENFATQWLQVRRLEELKFDASKFPGADAALKQDMIQEVVKFFDAIVREDRSVLELLDADFTFVSERLARHYGLSGSGRLKLADLRRGGILTMGAVLAATSDPDRTSPVKRGKWVLEAILGLPPPPPIPDAANLKDEPGAAGLTLRQRMEKHRADPNCASCHSKMDPIGFGFENYDATGAWRDRDGGKPLDTAAVLPDGRKFSGPVELKNILKAQKAEFTECLTEKMLTYALGRGVESFDGAAVREIADATAAAGYRMSSLVAGIARSYPFVNRQRDNRVRK
jgi:hypothetical protein